MSEKEPKFWDCQHSEVLTLTDMDEAIDSCLAVTDEDPETIEVVGYDPKELPDIQSISEQVLDDILTHFDEDDYGKPEEASGATQPMKDASLLFAATFRKEYNVWTCEKVCTKTINVDEWKTQNER